MSLNIYNTLSGKKEAFSPLVDKKVTMYICGPTVYHYIHVGNARPMVFFDVVHRYLKFKGYDVVYARNITDIDDKIIKRANEEKKPSAEIAAIYTQAFDQDMEALSLLKPSHSPKATEHIDQMIKWVEGLIQKGVAYEVNGEVFYSVEKFSEYGKLSKKKTEDLEAGARVEVAKQKKNPMDFVLWKPSKEGEPFWESPWGKGRPGWHLECSVMSTRYLGETFDIHGGGQDLIFPHHENEIAQSEVLTGKPFARYWMHNGMLVFGKEKMSKSLGNIVTVHEFLKKYPGEVLKFILLSNHYRSSLDFSEQSILESVGSLERIYSVLKLAKESLGRKIDAKGKVPKELKESIESAWKQIEAAMDDDFNTAKAFGLIFDVVRDANKYISEFKELSPDGKAMLQTFLKIFKNLGTIWGVFEKEPSFFLDELKLFFLDQLDITAEEIEDLIQARNEARQNKDWKKADAIRAELEKKKILLKDGPQGTSWKVLSS